MLNRLVLIATFVTPFAAYAQGWLPQPQALSTLVQQLTPHASPGTSYDTPGSSYSRTLPGPDPHDPHAYDNPKALAYAQTHPRHTYRSDDSSLQAAQIERLQGKIANARTDADRRNYEKQLAKVQAEKPRNPHAARMQGEYNKLMGRCQNGDQVACENAPGFRPGT
jgi:hypothetical protein